MRNLRGILPLAMLTAGYGWGQLPPDAEQPQRILQTVTAFARGYLDRLPDFTCVRTTRHWTAKAGTEDWTVQSKVAYELSYYGRQEHCLLNQARGVTLDFKAMKLTLQR